MSAETYFYYIFVPGYALLVLSIAAQWFRYRDRQRRDFALLFVVFFVSQTLPGFLPQTPWIGGAMKGLVVTSYFMILPALAHFRPNPDWLTRVGLISWLAALGLCLISPVLPFPLQIAIDHMEDLAGVVVLIHTGVAVVAGARQSGGVTRRRLLMIGAVALAMGMATVASVLLPGHPYGSPLAQISVLFYFTFAYFGFATPKWLSDLWQNIEFHTFMMGGAGLSLSSRADAMLARLVPTATQAVGGAATIVAVVQEGQERLLVRSDHLELEGALAIEKSHVLLAAARGRQALHVTRTDAFGPELARMADSLGCQSLFIVPIATHEAVFGYVITFLRQGALFPEADLKLLALMAEQTALSLAGWKMLADQQALIRRLEQTNTELERANADLEQANAELEQASRAKSAFLANMSHELRTPLNAIIGYSEMLREEAQEMGEAQFVSDLERIRSAGRHLLVLINDVLDLSKIEAGRMELHLELVSVPDMVRDVVATVEPLVEKNHNQLEVHSPADLGTMETDLTRTRQILFNLLSNAAKFTENGTIHLTVERQGSRYRFTVRDTGIGMTEEQMQRIFHDFTQADSSTTRKYGGTGLGLAITRRLVHFMGGEVQVDSQVGAGSTFTITLPADGHNPGAESVAEAETPPAVLVIDDDPGARDLLTRSLQREGFRVLAAAGGSEGIRMAREARPQVITLDILMPGRDGWAVLKALKDDPATAAIPVIVVSIVEEKNLGFALGAVDYLVKPVERERLLGAVYSHLQRPDAGPVLVVEDHDDTRAILCQTLEREGWPIRMARNGREGLEQVAEARPQLILLDLMMPEMDGFAFLTELRQRPEWAAIPVVVLTAMDLSAADRAWLNGRADRVVAKGALDREALLREVKRLVTSSTYLQSK